MQFYTKLTMTKKIQTVMELDAKSKKLWGLAGEKSKKHRYINFEDDVLQTVEIKDWNIHLYDTPWGKKPAVTCECGRLLKVESQRLMWELEEFVTKHVKLDITRHDSKPNSQNTWYEVSLNEA